MWDQGPLNTLRMWWASSRPSNNKPCLEGTSPQGSWSQQGSGFSYDDLESHMSDVQKLQRMLLKLENYGDVHPRLMHAMRSLRQCVHQAPAQSRIPDEAWKTCSSLRKCERRKSNALKSRSGKRHVNKKTPLCKASNKCDNFQCPLRELFYQELGKRNSGFEQNKRRS